MVTTLKSLRLLSQNLCVLYVEDDTILREQTQKVFQNLFKLVNIMIFLLVIYKCLFLMELN